MIKPFVGLMVVSMLGVAAAPSLLAADREEALILPCNPRLTAADYWFADAPEDAVTLWFETEEEAVSYQDPNGAYVYWLVAEGVTRSGVSYVAGYNDLWAVRFDVLVKQQCAINVTGEH